MSSTAMDDESFTNLPTSHLLGSVPAAVKEEGNNANNYVAPEASMQIFPPNNGGDRGRGYQSPRNPNGDGQPSTNNWQGVFSISSYTEYFNIDTDIVLNRLIGSLYPLSGDFFSNIDANPDLYGPVWVATTLMFVVAALGNCATYLMEKHSDRSTSWSFDVSYVSTAACAIYGYTLVVPLAFYFLLQYLGLNTSLVRFWCMWGYSLFVFVLASFLLVIPVEFLKWIVIILAGGASSCFVAWNLKSYLEGNDLTLILVSAFILQLGLALFLKIWFFA